MVLVKPIRLWAQNGTERATGTRVQAAHDFGCFSAFPALEHRDATAISQANPRDVDRTTLAVFRYFCARSAVARAAGIMRGDSEASQSATGASECRLGRVIHPCFQCVGGIAIHY